MENLALWPKSTLATESASSIGVKPEILNTEGFAGSS
jgi:hypothetical protein